MGVICIECADIVSVNLKSARQDEHKVSVAKEMQTSALYPHVKNHKHEIDFANTRPIVNIEIADEEQQKNI